ncbi:MAG: hypothetical protein ABFR82_05825 [Nitrospirota bacterium]
MRFDRFKKFILPPGPILALTLIGLMFSSALLYYKAVRAQRYLEPSLSIAQPRVDFIQDISRLLVKEFDTEKVNGIILARNYIFVNGSLIFPDPVHRQAIDSKFLKKLSQVFLAMLQDKDMRSQFDLVLVSTRFKVSPRMDVTQKIRTERQRIAESILNSLYQVEPGLINFFGTFTATAIPVQSNQKDNWVEFRIIPSEHMHIELMKSLNKYFF